MAKNKKNAYIDPQQRELQELIELKNAAGRCRKQGCGYHPVL